MTTEGNTSSSEKERRIAEGKEVADATVATRDVDAARTTNFYWSLLSPEHLYSPTHLLRIRQANSFELSNFLVCLLLGLGYNAFVVSGYASREQTHCDQRKRPCPYLPPPEEPSPPPPKADTSKYRPKSPPDFTSKFLAGIEERHRRKEQDEIDAREEARQRMIIELERPSADRYFGQRVHAWVALLPGGIGPRVAEITEPLFIETSTGEFWKANDPETANLYLGVESVWNNCNYWVNVQDCSEACSKLQWNLKDLKLWEHLLPGEPRHMRKEEEDEDDEENEETKIRREFHMVVPASYVGRIEIPYQDFEKRYPNGNKSIYYKKAKVEFFAPYLRSDGMSQSVTKYIDYEYKKPLYIYEKYENRGDYLVRSEKDLSKDLAIDFYKNGRPDACRCHKYFISSKGLVDEERTLEFYETKRLDELKSIKMHSLYLIQEFGDRDDRLYNRFTEYSPFNEEGEPNDPNDIHYRKITRIVERFRRNEQIPAIKDVAIREFNLIGDEIRLTFHFQGNQYTQAARIFIKPPASERGDHLLFTPEMTHGYNPDPMASPDDFDDLIDELEKQLEQEEKTIVEVRNGESEIFKFLQVRSNEYSNPELEVSIFDPIRNEEAKKGLLAMEEKIKAQSQRILEKEADFLEPYLARLGNIKYLTKKQAEKARSDCINDFKQTLVDRANSIMRTYERRNNELVALQKQLTCTEGLTKEEKEQLLEQVHEVSVHLRALEVRMNRHRQLAHERYVKLLNVLKRNTQISILYD